MDNIFKIILLILVGYTAGAATASKMNSANLLKKIETGIQCTTVK